jgi:tetratricopeptide (TPR) repeat protein
MKLYRCTMLLALALIAPLSACGQESLSAAGVSSRTAYRTGQYDQAISRAEASLRQDSSDVEAAVVLLRALLEVGRPADAVTAGTQLSARTATAPRLAWSLGRAYRALGKLSEAQAAFTRAQSGPDSLMARYELALLTFERGEHAAAMQEFDRFIDVYNTNRSRLTADELRAVAQACRMLGRDDPQLFKDALRAFDESIAKDTLELEGRVQLAEMFLEKFNGSDARTSLEAVLRVNPKHPRALLAMARLNAFEGAGKSTELVAQSLAVNPSDPDARALSAMQLIDVEQYDDASAEAQKGLVIDPEAPAPLIALAAARFMAGDPGGHRAALERAHARLRGSALAEVTLADVAARNRLYREAAAFAEAGVARDPKSARALALLGINQMRIGRIAEGSANLDRAFKLDPYDVWTKNTLDLIDTFKDYTELATPRFVISVETKDAPLLELFVGPLAEEAYDSLAARYGYRPPTPVRIEIFRSHADFSVRTVGLAGLGALGVSFGGVVAMDSPAARKVGEFNWGSTLWHELAHTFTLGASDNRVPRWFSEGLSVYEERRARTGWGSDASPALIAAYEGKRLHPVSRLNDGFVRPRYPEEVTLSYALASFVCEMIEADHGMAGIRRLLEAYKAGRTTEQAFREVLRAEPRAIDAKFDAWFRQKYAREFAAIAPGEGEGERGIHWSGDLRAAMDAAVAAAEKQQWDAAIAALERAKAMFPSFAGEGSPYHLLADIYRKRDDRPKAIAELSAIAARNEVAFGENLALAQLLESGGDVRGAAAALERTVYITPFNLAVHDSLATVASRAKLHPLAVRSRRAVLALDPSDRVEALYQLAKAHADAGDVSAARREVLRALDLAPNYEKAQALLLSLRTPEARQ